MKLLIEITTEHLEKLYETIMYYSKAKFGSEADSFELESDGKIKLQWSKYVGCGEYETTTEYISIENITEEE